LKYKFINIMASFQRSYKDIIRSLKKENSQTDKLETPINSSLLEEYVYDLSNQIQPITDVNIYKKTFAKKHNYQITAKFPICKLHPIEQINTQLETTLQISDEINADWHVGYYLAKYHLDLPDVISSFHAGISKDGLIRGVYYCITQNNKKTKWQIYGCDKNNNPVYKGKYINGLTRKCDIFDANTKRSVNIQLDDKLPLKSINLYTCDVACRSTAELIKEFLFIKEYLHSDITMILRIPDKLDSSSFITFLLFLISYFYTVKLFKSPWSKSHNYLILKRFKTQINQSTYMLLLNYLEQTEDIPLINKEYFDEDDPNCNLLIASLINSLKWFNQHEIKISTEQQLKAFL
jgi:hypothetical protein